MRVLGKGAPSTLSSTFDPVTDPVKPLALSASELSMTPLIKHGGGCSADLRIISTGFGSSLRES